MSDYYLSGEVEKCSSCNGRGYTSSENHPDCPVCSGAGYVEVKEGKQS
ncbi:hypothetical protein M5X00_29885 [Paenibacillus alvei]|nr:hypothetical protein [Paenibacillus alvei]EJW14433.1 hypothetical protein PAV_13c00520 [Paenibacillus alvei DSM 29]MCY9708193.1 hypothetical protein [Paenibacillus alvei]MCY9737901.1 hypothetical protein [Paenibacillus alvei]MCY9758433.1 hypothetical protein [Paenibacillus alvei]MEC0084507.1 hypothetical protein [Paenibacillus alvei]